MLTNLIWVMVAIATAMVVLWFIGSLFGKNGGR